MREKLVKRKASEKSAGEDETSDDNKWSWGTDSTISMLHLRSQRQEQFLANVRPKKELWQEIAEEMQKQGHLVPSGKDCDLKYRNMLQTFKKNRVKEERAAYLDGGESTITWEYYDLVKQIMSESEDAKGPGLHNFISTISLPENSRGSLDVKYDEVAIVLEPEITTTVSETMSDLSIYKRPRTATTSSAAPPRVELPPTNVTNESTGVPHKDRKSEVDFCSTTTNPISYVPGWALLQSELRECQVFGESVGLQLAHIKDAQTRALLQFKIQELLFKAKIGKTID